MIITDLNRITNFIWGVADDVLRDLYVRGRYRDVILPMIVLRRLDAVLEPTKPAVLQMKTTAPVPAYRGRDHSSASWRPSSRRSDARRCRSEAT
jgi:type I restriction enzyme M protein